MNSRRAILKTSHKNMTSDKPNPSEPVFQTPKPDELQSEEASSDVHDRIAPQLGDEADMVDDRDSHDADLDSNESVNRHLPGLATPPG